MEVKPFSGVGLIVNEEESRSEVTGVAFSVEPEKSHNRYDSPSRMSGSKVFTLFVQFVMSLAIIKILPLQPYYRLGGTPKLRVILTI